jgi:hypothetical protein
MSLRKANAICKVAHSHGFEAVLQPNGMVMVSDEDGFFYARSITECKQWMGY